MVPNMRKVPEKSKPSVPSLQGMARGFGTCPPFAPPDTSRVGQCFVSIWVLNCPVPQPPQVKALLLEGFNILNTFEL